MQEQSVAYTPPQMQGQQGAPPMFCGSCGEKGPFAGTFCHLDAERRSDARLRARRVHRSPLSGSLSNVYCDTKLSIITAAAVKVSASL